MSEQKTDPSYTYFSLPDALKRIHQVSCNVAPENQAAVLNYIQFIAIEALEEAKEPVTAYGAVGSPPPPCPQCPPGT